MSIKDQVSYLFRKYQQFPDDQLPAWIGILTDEDVTRATSCLYHSLFNTGDLASETKHLAAYSMLLGAGYPKLAAEERRIALAMSGDQSTLLQKLAAVERFAVSSNIDDVAHLSDAEILALRLAKCAESFPHIVRGELVQDFERHYTPQQIVELVMALAVIGIGQRWSGVWEPLHDYTL